MVFVDEMLVELKNILFGINNIIEIDLERKMVNYNENGDLYYVINTYSNNEVKSILVCAKVDNISSYYEVCLEEDDRSFFDLIERIIKKIDEIDKKINIDFTYKARNAREK